MYWYNGHLLLLIALINFSLRFSALSLFKDITAHIAAGNQPISVICNMRQTIPEIILPRKMKERNGSTIASSIFSINELV